MHTYSLFNILVLFELLGTFLIVFLCFPLFLFTIVVSLAPKRKSTPARNPLHSGASSSSDSALLSLRFRNDDAHKAFSENFSRRGVHYAKSYRRTLLTLTFPLSFIVGDESHCVMIRSLVRPCWSRSLLQHAWFWFFSTSLFYSRLRYAHYSHIAACCGCASCSEGRASLLPRL